MERLTSVLHKKLVSDGYKFLLFKEVERISLPPHILNILVHPQLTTNLDGGITVTGIQDSMITGILDNEKIHIHLYTNIS